MNKPIPPKLRRAIIDFPDKPARGQVKRFCKGNDISTSVFYKIKQRAQHDGVDQALTVGKRGPKNPPPGRTSPQLEQIVLSIRADLIKAGLDGGPLSVAAKMRRNGAKPPSRATLARIFTRNGVVIPEPKKRPRSSFIRFAYPAPNDCWQLDGTKFVLDDGTTLIILQVEDDHSRMILASLVSHSENGPAAIEVVSLAIKRHGVPQRFLTDNHLALNQHRRGRIAPLERFMQSLGVQTMSGQYRHPQTQGKNERLHLTLFKFLEANRPIYTKERLIDLVEKFTDYYNHDRAHQSLDTSCDQTPAEAWQATAKAPPPTPPEPVEPVSKPAKRVPGQSPAIEGHPEAIASADRTVDPYGSINICNCRIYLGRPRAGQVVHVLWDQTTITIFDADGNEIGAITRPKQVPKRGYTRFSLSPWSVACGTGP